MFTEFFNKIYGAAASIPFDALIWFIWGGYISVFSAVLILTLCSAKFKAYPKRPFFHLTNAFAATTFAAFLSECGVAQSLTATTLFWTAGYVLYGALCALTGRSKKRRSKAIKSVATSGTSPPAADSAAQISAATSPSAVANRASRAATGYEEEYEIPARGRKAKRIKAKTTSLKPVPAKNLYEVPPPPNKVEAQFFEPKSEPPRQIAPAAKNSVRLEHAIAVTDKLLLKNLSKADRSELEKLKNTLAVLKIKGTLNPAESEILNDNFNALLKLMAKYNM